MANKQVLSHLSRIRQVEILKSSALRHLSFQAITNACVVEFATGEMTMNNEKYTEEIETSVLALAIIFAGTLLGTICWLAS